jgi:hypothetical protein
MSGSFGSSPQDMLIPITVLVVHIFAAARASYDTSTKSIVALFRGMIQLDICPEANAILNPSHAIHGTSRAHLRSS